MSPIKCSLFVVGMFLMANCSKSTYGGTSDSRIDQKEIQSDNYMGSAEETLAYMLRKESGVIVSERYGRTAVRIRGLSTSINNSSSPLFVINGTAVGHEFATAAELVAGGEIQSIKVLKDQSASFYGVRGAAGVIEIRTAR